MLPLAADDPPPQAMGRVSFDARIPGHDAARCGGRRNDGGACTEKPSLIRYKYGHVTILNREDLQERPCEHVAPSR